MEQQEKIKKKSEKILAYINEKQPLVHCITNAVTVNDCANVLLAAGARPTMAHHPLEVSEITSGCDALVCNFGATDDYKAMFSAAETANSLGHPIVIDPVGAGGSMFRREKIREFLERFQVSCIRGNASEMRALFEDSKTVVGVDARETDTTIHLHKPANLFAKQHKCVCVISGKEDVITDGRNSFLVKNGDDWMSRITGSGCMSTALFGAAFAAENSIYGAVIAAAAMGICGEKARELCRQEQSGTMSFKMYMIDALSLLTPEVFQENVNADSLCKMNGDMVQNI